MTKVKAFVDCRPTTLGRGLHRVAHALARYAPKDVEIVADPVAADIVVIHVIGHGSMEGWAFRDDQKIGMMQYCMMTTEDARPEAWMKYWERAAAVWSYYDLNAYVDRNSRVIGGGGDAVRQRWSKVKFYHAPLGVDGDIFRPSMPRRNTFIVGTSGYVAETEGVKECYAAAASMKQQMFHLGPMLNLGPGVSYLLGCTDDEVADMWSQCSYVAGMRRIEGFELPALEGLACGSRPVVFDAPHYRNWFGEHAEYVPEADHDTVVEALKSIFSKRLRVVTPSEREAVVNKFNWEVLVKGFWEALL